MDENKLISVIGNAVGGGVVAGALILVLWRVFSRIADRFIASFDRFAAALAEHTEKDLEHHATVQSAVVRVEAKVDAALDWHERTPVETPPVRSKPRARTNPHGASYPVRRDKEGE